MTTRDKLAARVDSVGAPLCIGLDLGPHTTDLLTPDYDNPGRLNRHLIDTTHEYAAAYKFQLAGYMALGLAGFAALRTSIEYLRTAYPAIPVVLDGKFSDIAVSLGNYAAFAFDYLKVDAVTASPLLGRDANAPLLARADKLVYFLCSTTNPGSAEFQSVGEPPLYRRIAEQVAGWGEGVGLVVGATHPERAAEIRGAAPDVPFLIPGVGAQGGDAGAILGAARGTHPADTLVNASRSIIRADDPAQAAADLHGLLRDAITTAPPPADQAERLRHLLIEAGCVQFGEYTLASGAKSDIYVDLRKLAAHPDLLRRVAVRLAALTRDLAVDVIATIPTAGLPLGTALSLLTGIPLAYVRAEAKAYGAGQRIEGAAVGAGTRALLLDDVISTGGSKRPALDALREAGADVAALAVVVDRREQPGTPFAGLPVRALTTLAVLRR